MNSDKAYILGLIIGGSIWSDHKDTFQINLPYRQWGSLSKNTSRATQISKDIMRIVSPMFHNIYGLNISFEASDVLWTIFCEGDTTELIQDMRLYGIEPSGEIRANANITKLIPALTDDNLKRRFIAGLADTIGSTAPSHRRFSDENQIISFEIKGFNFKFICDLCNLFYSIHCFADQILWNHPNFHTGKNPYYQRWNKGFKLRITLDQYEHFGSFAFRSRAKSAKDNLTLQKNEHIAIPCTNRPIRVSQTCVHPAEHDARLPIEIRDGHYLHNRHVCAVLGCKHAPYDQIATLCSHAGDLITPFPILSKGSLDQIEEIIANDALMSCRIYQQTKISVSSLFEEYKKNNNALLYGNTENGYPISEIIQSVAYVIATNAELHGNRIRGNFCDHIKSHLQITPNLTVEIRIPDLLTPLVICANNKATLVGAHNHNVYEKLITISNDNPYKILVREITEDDLRNAK